jgi:hypothetical protein
MILTLRLQNASKLITMEDSLHIHKILGFMCFCNYIYRFSLWFIFGARFVYAMDNELLFWIACHSMLSISSLIFHLPKKRRRGRPVIWPEFRMHSILFAMRSLLVMLTHALVKDPIWSYGIRSSILVGTMISADLTTRLLGSEEKTMRGMPFPTETSLIVKNRINMYYSICQVLATTKMIYSAEPPYQIAEPFFILFPIQLAAFLMTLVKKGIMTTEGWHFYYILFLGINFVYFAMIPFSQNRFPVMAVSIFFSITRFRFRLNKYMLWFIIIIIGSIWIDTVSYQLL